MLLDFLWTEKYRPRKIDDCILPVSYKKLFKQFVADKNIPNIMLAGSAGIGKTTVARALVEEIGSDYILINGSLYGNIDTLRNEISSFASSSSLMGGRKYVILDEADYLNANSTQPALRNFMEEFSKNCGFILTCNYKNRIIEPLHSRCSVIEMKIEKTDAPALASQFHKRAIEILRVEKIEFNEKVVAGVIMKYFPDWRRVLNELQRHGTGGKIENDILSNSTEESFAVLMGILKKKSFTELRKWVTDNMDNDTNALFKKLYDTASLHMQPASIPQLVITLAEYQYKAAFVADQEINMAACLTEVMANCVFK